MPRTFIGSVILEASPGRYGARQRRSFQSLLIFAGCLITLPRSSPARSTTRVFPIRPIRGLDLLRSGHDTSEVAMPSVRVRENEYFDAALRRFKRACEKAGVLTELRRREFYEKPTQERKRKKAAAVKRHMKRSRRDFSAPRGARPRPSGASRLATEISSLAGHLRRPVPAPASSSSDLIAFDHVPQRTHHRRHEGGHARQGQRAPRHDPHDHRRDQAARSR